MKTIVGAPLLYLGGLVAGVSFVIQQAVNARLRSELGSPWWAGFASYLGGTIVMAVVILLVRDPWPPLAAVVRTPWWAWAGGLFGVVYIVAAILLLPRLGAAAVVALIVVGQMGASVAVDALGAFGLQRHPIDAPRLLGAVLLVVGVVLIRR